MLDIHVVSHTHWDREWYLTHEQFRFRLVALVDRLLDLLDADPGYKHFHLDGQTIVLEDYLEIRPEQEARLRKAIEDGRILIGPWYVMPDEFLVSGESLVRNLLRGHRLSREFGTPMPVGYLPDLFGHVGQMPQIWRQFGLDNTILWRGFGGPNAEYWWDAPDGSRLLMMHLPPEGYCNATRIVFDPEAMMARAKEKVDFERGRTRTGQALLMNGVDHVEPHTSIPSLVEHLTFETKAKFILCIETGGMFQRLQSHKFWQKSHCILISMAGVPTRATRRFVRRLSDQCKLPVYAFVDCDPYGISNIYRTLKVGSGNAAHINRFFCVPQASFLGVTPQDITEYKLPTHPLKDVDVKRAKDALKNDPFFKIHKRWAAAMEQLVKMGVRAEQQALARWGLNYVIDEYLPRKLKAVDAFLP